MTRSLDFLTAVGIGVTDLVKSADFYSRVLGLVETGRFKLDHMDEIMLSHEGRSSVVLMHYTDGSAHNYRDNPVKLMFYVAELPRILALVRAEGLEILREPAPIEALGGAVVALAKDPDGYVIELIQRPARAA